MDVKIQYVQGRPLSTLSKVRYAKIGMIVQEEMGTGVSERVMQIIKDVMRFDPEGSQYDSERRDKIREWRQRRATELGVTVSAVARGLKNTHA